MDEVSESGDERGKPPDDSDLRLEVEFGKVHGFMRFPAASARQVSGWDRLLAVMAWPGDVDLQLALREMVGQGEELADLQGATFDEGRKQRVRRTASEVLRDDEREPFLAAVEAEWRALEVRRRYLAAVHLGAMAANQALLKRAGRDETIRALLEWQSDVPDAGLGEDGGWPAASASVSLDGANAEWNARAVRGCIAGDLLLLCLRPVRRIGRRATISLREGVFLLSQHLSGPAGRLGSGDRVASSPSRIRDYWYEFRSVAHFWAAYREIVMRQELQPKLIDFLRAANGLQEAALQRRLAKPEQCWFVPKSIDGAAVGSEPPVLDPLSEDGEAMRAGYRSNPSRT